MKDPGAGLDGSFEDHHAAETLILGHIGALVRTSPA